MTMTIVFVGIGLANNLFALHGWVESGKTTLVCPVLSNQTLEAVADLTSLNIILEISSGISPRRAFEDTSHRSGRQQVNSANPEWNPFKQDSTTNKWSPAERFVSGPAPRQGA